MPQRRVSVILNAGAGRDAVAPADVRRAFRRAGVDAEVIATPGDKLADAASAAVARGADVVVAAGGDGTVNAVAGALAGSDAAMGVLPLGTLNHFARDIGVPVDLDAAAALIATGEPRRIDLGEVNGRIFVNNSSIGLYPAIVVDRDAQRERAGRGKWVAMLVAIGRTLRRFPRLRVRVDLLDKVLPRVTPFVFVGNNRFLASPGAVGRRDRLDGGELSVLTAHSTSRWRLVWMAIAAIVRPGREPRAKGLDAAARPALVIDADRGTIRVALDGEVVRMRPPLRYRILPGALRVVGPGGDAA
ncbi:MAG TPA: diacylglycerol kinase family protein [Candidatus Thermoplasmatota archaeon]|nr:diacylglycerol kinase family protein [Candidatus Thermoplasmatota archaeon]